MSDIDRAFADLVTANPIPHGASEHPEALTATALLEVIDARSVDTIPEPGSAAPARPSLRERRSGLLIAAAVFLVIVVSVGAIALLATGSDEVIDTSTTVATTTSAPTTTVPPTSTTQATTTAAPTTTTTTEAPQVDAADQAAIDAFVETFNANDWEATVAALAPNAEVWSDLIGYEDALPITEFGDLIRRWFRFSANTQSRMTISSCSPLDDGRINCRGTLSDSVVDQSPLGEAGLSATFRVDDEGRVSYFFMRENRPSMTAAYGFFFNWLDETYPGESDILSVAGGMSLLDDALELLPIRVAEWIATLEE